MSVVEIAKLAGVSTATVSRVLNNHPSVRPETVQQVRRVLTNSGYARPLIRRGPRLGPRERALTGNVAVVAVGDTKHTRFQNPVFAQTLEGIVAAGRESNLNVLIDYLDDADAVPRAVRNRDVDGALLFVPNTRPDLMGVVEALRREVPLVHVMGSPINGFDHVGPDNAAVGQLAAEYLLSTGVRELTLMTSEPSWELNRTRAGGFISVACRENLTPVCYLVTCSAIDAEGYSSRTICTSAIEELAERIASSARVGRVGLFITRDADTSVLQPLLVRRGVEPEKDVVIISCNNEEARLSVLDPRPPSIDLAAEDIGRRALVRLAGRIRKPEEPPFRLLVAPRLDNPSPQAR